MPNTVLDHGCTVVNMTDSLCSHSTYTAVGTQKIHNRTPTHMIMIISMCQYSRSLPVCK